MTTGAFQPAQAMRLEIVLTTCVFLIGSLLAGRADKPEDTNRRLKRGAEMKKMLLEIAELRRQGKHEELAAYETLWQEKFGTSPSTVHLADMKRVSELTSKLHSLGDESLPESFDLIQALART
jgi:hypothetical protein